MNNKNPLKLSQRRPRLRPGGLVNPIDHRFVSEQRLLRIAALGARVTGAALRDVRVPRNVGDAIRDLNDLSLLAANIKAGNPAAGGMFEQRISGWAPGHVQGPDPQAIMTALGGMRGPGDPARPCSDSIGGAGPVLDAALGLDFVHDHAEPTLTREAAAYMRGRLRAISRFEQDLWHGAAYPGDLPGGIPPDGGGLPPGGYRPDPGGPSDPIFPPDHPLPDPPPDPGGPGDLDPGFCDRLAELCIALYEHAAISLMGDPFRALIGSVEPNCVCHDFDPATVFTARPKPGREFPVPFPGDLRLIFRGDDITARIVQPVTAQELRFTLPDNAETGFVYLRGAFPNEWPGSRFPERLCGMSMPDLPRLPGLMPGVLIGIIHPPVFETLTVNGDPGPAVIAERCRDAEICWDTRLADQEARFPIPHCARIELTIRDDADNLLFQSDDDGCFSLAGDDDQTVRVQARSYADQTLCGETDVVELVIERISRVTLLRIDPAGQELHAGDGGSFTVRISCPAPNGGTTVRLEADPQGSIQVPAQVQIAAGATEAQVNFASDEEFRGNVHIRGWTAGHQEGWLFFHMVPSPEQLCDERELNADPWSAPDVEWANWGIVDTNRTFFGFLPAEQMFRPTSQYETAKAIRIAEADGRTIRALGSGWGFSETVLPQETAISLQNPANSLPIRTAALAGVFSEEVLHSFARNLSDNFGYAIDTKQMDRSLQAVLPDILPDDADTSSLFFVEAGMTINFLNTLLDSQDPPLALATMGGATGQTIAGAFSTGTHGADIDRPPLADAVRAIYLVGQGGQHHWIEPADGITDPAKLAQIFPCAANNIHYDDDMFDATLVSFGAMGVIYAVILDVVPQYSLLQWNRWSTWEQLKADQEGNDFLGLFTGTWSGMLDFLQNEFAGGFQPNRFTQVVINPIRNAEGEHNCYVSNRVQLSLRDPSGVTPLDDYTSIDEDDIVAAITSAPEFGVFEGIHFHFHRPSATGDLLLDLQNLLVFLKDSNYPWAVRAVTDAVMRQTFPLPRPAPGLPANPQIDRGFRVMAPGGEERAFPPLGTASVEPAFSFFREVPAANQPGLNVVVPDAITFVDDLLDTFDQAVASDDRVFPSGWISLRVTGRTRALLGMQRFERSAMVEISLIGRPDGFDLINVVEQLARQHGAALHWGQANARMNFADLESNFGNNRIDIWKAVQQQLGGATFTNLFMQRVGLT